MASRALTPEDKAGIRQGLKDKFPPESLAWIYDQTIQEIERVRDEEAPADPAN